MSAPASPLVTSEELKAVWKDARLIDARSGEAGRAAYRAGHLHGALHADLDSDLAAATHRPDEGGRHPLPDANDFARRLGEWGIGPETHVVVYDDQAGANAASRLWWMLRSLGHERVQVLDGGFQAAVAAGIPVDQEVPEAQARRPYPHEGWTWPVVSADEVEARRQDPHWRLLDVRDPRRYRGEVEPLDPIAGHIPGAINLPYAWNLDEEGRFLSPSKLRLLYYDMLGPAPPSRLIVHCGSGVTACHTLLALERAGMPGAKLYVGSWSEWCRSGRPQATGED